ncbi:MAG: NAD(P)-dependent oxidoreductase [Myxococcota bacterium]
MKLLVTGASSFLGAHFSRVAARQHTIYALYFSTPLRLNGVTPMRADLRTIRDRRRVQELRFDAVVHIACKIRATPRPGEDETPGQAAQRENRAMMDAVLSFNRPILYASSTVVHWEQDSPYASSRREDEKRLKESGLPWSIMRPSAPYARHLANHRPAHRESFHTLVDIVRRSPLVPVIGDGTYRRQPIHIDDFSAAALALLRRGLPNRAFDAGGGEALSFNDIIKRIAAAQGRRRVLPVHLPKAIYVQLAKLSPDFDPDLIAAIDEDEIADPAALSEATGVRPRPFSEGVHDLVAP